MKNTKVIPGRKLKSLIGYTKRSMFATLYDHNEPLTHSTSSFWDSGSKDCYIIINLSSGESIVPFGGSYPSFRAETIIGPGSALIRYGTCLGKPATAHLYGYMSDIKSIIPDFIAT